MKIVISLRQSKSKVFYFSILVYRRIWIILPTQKFEPPPLLCTSKEHRLPAMFGADRCTVNTMGLYLGSVSVVSPGSSSASKSTICLLVYGAWKDDHKGIHRLYTKINYHKDIERFQRLPTMITFVKYSTNGIMDNSVINNNCTNKTFINDTTENFICDLNNNNSNSDSSEDIDMITTNSNNSNNNSNSNSTDGITDIDMIVTNNSNSNSTDGITDELTSRESASAVVAYNTKHHTMLNGLRKPYFTKYKQEWLVNNPIKHIPTVESEEQDATLIEGFNYRKDLAVHMNINCHTPKRKGEKKKISINWVKQLNELQSYFKNYTATIDLLITKGWKNPKEKGEIILTEFAQRSSKIPKPTPSPTDNIETSPSTNTSQTSPSTNTSQTSPSTNTNSKVSDLHNVEQFKLERGMLP